MSDPDGLTSFVGEQMGQNAELLCGPAPTVDLGSVFPIRMTEGPGGDGSSDFKEIFNAITHEPGETNSITNYNMYSGGADGTFRSTASEALGNALTKGQRLRAAPPNMAVDPANWDHGAGVHFLHYTSFPAVVTVTKDPRTGRSRVFVVQYLVCYSSERPEFLAQQGGASLLSGVPNWFHYETPRRHINTQGNGVNVDISLMGDDNTKVSVLASINAANPRPNSYVWIVPYMTRNAMDTFMQYTRNYNIFRLRGASLGAATFACLSGGMSVSYTGFLRTFKQEVAFSQLIPSRRIPETASSPFKDVARSLNIVEDVDQIPFKMAYAVRMNHPLVIPAQTSMGEDLKKSVDVLSKANLLRQISAAIFTLSLRDDGINFTAVRTPLLMGITASSFIELGVIACVAYSSGLVATNYAGSDLPYSRNAVEKDFEEYGAGAMQRVRNLAEKGQAAMRQLKQQQQASGYVRARIVRQRAEQEFPENTAQDKQRRAAAVKAGKKNREQWWDKYHAKRAGEAATELGKLPKPTKTTSRAEKAEYSKLKGIVNKQDARAQRKAGTRPKLARPARMIASQVGLSAGQMRGARIKAAMELGKMAAKDAMKISGSEEKLMNELGKKGFSEAEIKRELNKQMKVIQASGPSAKKGRKKTAATVQADAALPSAPAAFAGPQATQQVSQAGSADAAEAGPPPPTPGGITRPSTPLIDAAESAGHYGSGKRNLRRLTLAADGQMGDDMDDAGAEGSTPTISGTASGRGRGTGRGSGRGAMGAGRGGVSVVPPSRGSDPMTERAMATIAKDIAAERAKGPPLARNFKAGFFGDVGNVLDDIF